MLILNLKNYPEATGKNVSTVLDSVHKAVSQNPEVSKLVSLSPAVYDLHHALENSNGIKVFAQHVDMKIVGSTTGWMPAESLLKLGVEVSVLNHSEHRFTDWVELEETIREVQSQGLKLVVCCENLEEAEKLLELNPYAIAYEDKDLIGSGQSITTGRPEEVKNFISLTKGKTKVVIGAGISTGEDVSQGLQFGAEGFILASAFVKAEDKTAKLLELAQPFLDIKN